MAPSTGTLRVGRYFLALLVLFAVLYSIVIFGARHTPKLGIDLVGGTEVVFTAKTDNGSAPSRSSMDQARQILSDRVNGTGVTQSTVVIQGSDQLVVSIPGQDSTDIQKLGAAAVLNLRGLVAPAAQVTCTPAASTGSSAKASSQPSSAAKSSAAPSGASSSAPQSGAAAAVRPLAPASSTGSAKSGTSSSAKQSGTASTSATSSTTATSSASPTSSASASQQVVPCSATTLTQVAAIGKFTIPLSEADYTKLSSNNQQLVSAALAAFDCASAQTEKDVPKSYYVACDKQGLAYLLGPVVVAGKQIADASVHAPDSSDVAYRVALDLKPSGQSKWAAYTSAHNVNGGTPTGAITSCGASTTPCADYVGFTLDGSVISIPYNVSAINGGQTEIKGSFTASSSKDLANQLKYGALPLSFAPANAQTVSATLGTSQLKAGLLAGGIGLVLVVIYSLMYYRALGLVTIASLVISGVLTYGALVMLGTQIGFTLSLAGIAGFIVAVGITADSFVVFFERLKDEVHEGRSARVAVPRAWVRARRTILSADTVSFLAAAVLYYFTTDEVRGFAFTLGLSTILDLVVVFLFTHPLVSLLSRLREFGSATFSGLDALRGVPLPDTAPSSGGRPPRPARVRTDPSRAATAVLDDDTELSTESAGEAPAITPRAKGSEAPLVDETSSGATDSDEPTAPRRRTAPAAGSAAERAAARRARLRDRKSGEKGQD